MSRVSKDFGIVGVVEFLDVNVERDNLLFIDPSAIRAAAMAGDAYGRQASDELTRYFDYILGAVNSSDPTVRAAGEAALQHFGEIGSTRLGMSKHGTAGHGAAAKLGSEIWSELTTNPLCELAIARLKYIEDVPLFVDGIDRDITSDLTARVVVTTLARFTRDMMARHPEFSSARPTVPFESESWDPHRKAWVPLRLTVPEADGKPLLLVPRSFVNYRIEMSYGQYYGVALLDFIQSEDMVTVTRRNQEVERPRFFKKELRDMPQFQANRSTNTEQTKRIFLDKEVDVLGDYRSEKQSSFVSLDDDTLEHYLAIEP
jgi:hypothetical protein